MEWKSWIGSLLIKILEQNRFIDLINWEWKIEWNDILTIYVTKINKHYVTIIEKNKYSNIIYMKSLNVKYFNVKI